MAKADDAVFDETGNETEDESAENTEDEAGGEEPPDTPDLGSVQLRDYQERAVRAVLSQFTQKINSTLVVAATGTGKSICLAELAHRANGWGHGVLLLVHRDELIRQLSRSCARVGIHALIEKAGEHAQPGFPVLSKTVCASVQTLRGDRLQSWPRNTFKLIIIDEAHHCAAKSYRAVLDHFEGARHVGFTATADRLDGKNIGQVFETLAFDYNIRDAIGDGWLVPIEAIQLETDPPVNLKELRVTAGDFNTADLERVVQENIGVLVNAIVQTNALEQRRTIAFTPDIASAQSLALALSDVGISARAISSKSSDRAEIIAGHKSGEFQTLVNCMILTEGYDDPEVSCILMCRPTRSRSLYSQMCGRGTRPHPESGKMNCRIVDFAYLTGQHELVSAVDLYDNSHIADEVVASAREMMKAGGETDIERALEQAQLQFEETRRVKIKRLAASVKASRFDPVAACAVYGIEEHKAAYDWQDVRRASSRQVEALRKWGINAPDDMAAGIASQLLSKVCGRKEYGWASPRQVAALIESGFEAEAATGMRDTEAREYLEAHPLGPTSKQVKMLRWKGVSDAEIAGFTRRQASQRIDALMKGSQ